MRFIDTPFLSSSSIFTNLSLIQIEFKIIPKNNSKLLATSFYFMLHNNIETRKINSYFTSPSLYTLFLLGQLETFWDVCDVRSTYIYKSLDRTWNYKSHAKSLNQTINAIVLKNCVSDIIASSWWWALLR